MHPGKQPVHNLESNLFGGRPTFIYWYARVADPTCVGRKLGYRRRGIQFNDANEYIVMG